MVISSLRLLWCSRRFFTEEHAAHAMTAVLGALAHFAGSGLAVAVDACMHFLCDLLNGYYLIVIKLILMLNHNVPFHCWESGPALNECE